MIAKVYELLQIEVDFEIKDGTKDSEKWETFLDEIDLPENAGGLFEIRKDCVRCGSVSSIFCVACREILCNNCEYRNHIDKKHQNATSLLLELENGTLK